MANNPTGEQLDRAPIALGVFVTLAVILRYLARWKSKADFAVDDVLIAISVLPQYAMIVISAELVSKGGLGLPAEAHTPSQASLFLKLEMCGLVTYSLSITLVKISLLLLYRRIFSTPAFKKKVLVVGVICIFWFLVSIFMDVFQCHPFHDAFNPEMLFTDHCINLQNYYWGITGANLGIDVIMLFLPLHMVWDLKLPARQKVLLSGIFMLGGVVCIAGAMRIVKIGYIRKEDVTVTTAAEYTWSEVEPATAILCACVVTYRPLFTNLNLNFSKVSSIFGKGGAASKATRDEGWKDLEGEPNLELQWPVGRDMLGRNDLRLQHLNAKATNDGLHVINVHSLQSDNDAAGGRVKGITLS